MKSTRKLGKNNLDSKSQPWRKVNGQSQRKSTSLSTMTSANWRVTSADDVAAMMSPRADVSRRKLGACRCVMACGGEWRRVTEPGGAWRCMEHVSFCAEYFGSAWELRWRSGFHERVDQRRKILVVPAKTQSEQGSQWQRSGSGLETLNDDSCRSRTRDDD